MSSTTTVDKIPTGVPGFDTISNGGIPRGRSTLVVGPGATARVAESGNMVMTLGKP